MDNDPLRIDFYMQISALMILWIQQYEEMFEYLKCVKTFSVVTKRSKSARQFGPLLDCAATCRSLVVLAFVFFVVCFISQFITLYFTVAYFKVYSSPISY